MSRRVATPRCNPDMQIISRWDAEHVLWSGAAESLLEALRAALAVDVDLRDADLRGACLRGADLRGANLRGIYLSDADLTDADLTGACLTDTNLHGAYLRGTYLRGADLRGAYLTDADLTSACLRGADLRGADLRGAYLRGTYLSDAADLTDADLTGACLTGYYLPGADLSDVREDLFDVLDSSPGEVAGLLAALREGRVDGSVYEGACACLVGTLANVRGCHYMAIPGLVPDSERLAEIWFLSIRPGHTPTNYGPAALAAEWIAEWQALRKLEIHPPPRALDAHREEGRS